MVEEQKQLAWLVMETLTVLLQGSNINAGTHSLTLTLYYYLSTMGAFRVFLCPGSLGLPNCHHLKLLKSTITVSITM